MLVEVRWKRRMVRTSTAKAATEIHNARLSIHLGGRRDGLEGGLTL